MGVEAITVLLMKHCANSFGAGRACLAACRFARRAGATGSFIGALSPEPQLVILDTDIGDDIDDAFALALVLRSRSLKLVGVTRSLAIRICGAKLVGRYLVRFAASM